MIVTELYNGQGLGNQLWCYFVTRVIAHRNGYEFGIQSPYKFKGKEFMTIDFGKEVIGGSGPEGGPPITLPESINSYYRERTVSHPNGIDISRADSGLVSIPDGTKIDGCMQSLSYIKEYRAEIKNWIKLTKNDDISMDMDTCIIHIRGGDFRFSSAFLNKNYYDNAINHMLYKNPNMKFAIVTDDIGYSRSIYPNIPIVGGSSTGVNDSNIASHHIGGPIWMDWLILSNAKNVIMSASSFSFWPVYLNDNVDVIAPMYWADYNRSNGYWSTGDIIVDGWRYLNRSNELVDSDTCQLNLKSFEKENEYMYTSKL